MPIQLKDLQDKAKYKKALKDELGTLKSTPTVFHYFDKFKFDDGKLGPLVLAGDLMRKDLFEAVKNTDAAIKARGKVAKTGDQVQFLVEMGSIPLDKLKVDMGNLDTAEVKKLGDPPAAPADAALKGAAEAKLALLTKQFDAIKGRVSDDDRKKLHDQFGTIGDALLAGRNGDAITAMKATEQSLAKHGKDLRDDKFEAEGKAGTAFDNAAKAAEATLAQTAAAQKAVDDLTTELKSTQQKAGVQDSKKSKQAQASALKLHAAAKTLKTQLDAARESLTSATKAKDADLAKLKPLTAKLFAAQASYDLATQAMQAVGKLADNAELDAAGKAISAKVGQMAEASEFQKGSVDQGHGTGRHGAQTGIENQARRIASDVTPDQAHNKGGTAENTAQWKTTIKWKQVPGKDGKLVDEKDAQGKRIVDQPAKLVQKVIDEVANTFATKTTSMFLNPALEHEAVKKALAIANAQCPWTEWDDGGTWTFLTSLTIVVPPPDTAKGYGLQVGRAETFAKQAGLAAAGHVKDFESGKVKTIDELMKLLDAQIATDRTGDGAYMVKHARVVLERANTGAAWTTKTHFPTDDPPGWDCAKGVPLTGKTVRLNPTQPGVVAPDYAR